MSVLRRDAHALFAEVGHKSQCVPRHAPYHIAASHVHYKGTMPFDIMKHVESTICCLLSTCSVDPCFSTCTAVTIATSLLQPVALLAQPLTNDAQLDVSHNFLEVIPHRFSWMLHLAEVCFLLLKSFPALFLKPFLRYFFQFQAGHNSIPSLPSDIGLCSALTCLHLSRNKIAELPIRCLIRSCFFVRFRFAFLRVFGLGASALQRRSRPLQLHEPQPAPNVGCQLQLIHLISLHPSREITSD